MFEGDPQKAEMELCYVLQFETGVDGMIVCGSRGKVIALDADEKIEIIKIAK